MSSRGEGVGPYGEIEAKNKKERLTASVILTCIVAASCGLIFGYDMGISGGVTTMPPFLEKFFPLVLQKMKDATQNTYCVFDSQILTLFTSSLSLAGLVSCLVASRVTRAMGRKAAILLGGSIFFAGSALNAASVNLFMLILGRLLLGLGLGFTNQAAPLYISEMAPAKYRGGLTSTFNLFVGIGVLFAAVVNVNSAGLGSWGWRLSLGLGVVPAALMTLGALLVTDTPSSLVERGKLTEARQALTKIRGVDSETETELGRLIEANEAAKEVNKESLMTIFQRQYRPHLVFAVIIPIFQQLTGINTIAFYAPVLFQSIGFGNNTALIGAAILGLVNIFSIATSLLMVDRFGRRALLIEGGCQMLICQMILAVVLRSALGASGDEQMSRHTAIWVLVLMCIYAAGFGWSWGPLCFLIPSEIFPMRIRPIGQSVTVAVQFLTTFVLAQTFLTMLCHLKYAVFWFNAGWLIFMTVFIGVFLPETKGVPLESMNVVWEKHWYWRRFTS